MSMQRKWYLYKFSQVAGTLNHVLSSSDQVAESYSRFVFYGDAYFATCNDEKDFFFLQFASAYWGWYMRFQLGSNIF